MVGRAPRSASLAAPPPPRPGADARFLPLLSRTDRHVVGRARTHAHVHTCILILFNFPRRARIAK